MSRTVTISDALADLLESRKQAEGQATLDAVAETLIARAIAEEQSEDYSAGMSEEALGGLIDEAEASGPAIAWDAASVREEVLRRYAARKRA
jgi:hypothetical protein